MSRERLIIAIDGPAASGKSTTARLVAERLGYTYIDTGAMYRAVTLAILRAGIDPADREAVERLASEITIHLERADDGALHTYLGDQDVSAAIRSSEVTATVSLISSYPGVRSRLVEIQKRIGASGGVVLDGRDIGTVVFPDADVKVFMIADINARAQRRHVDLEKLGDETPVDGIVAALRERDRFDSTRQASPLVKADDAVEIDTSCITIEEQVDRVIDLVRRRTGR
jgi:cytidylate kinase